MKIGIIGFKGFVGSAFYEVFSADSKCLVIGIERSDLEQARKENYDLLINCNGNSSKRLADKDPAIDFQMNVSTTLDFLVNFKCEKYVHVSTCEVYENRKSPKVMREDTEINPLALSNYGFSKYTAEQAVKKYAKKWLIVRLSGMVGKNMSKGPAFDILNLHKIFISEKSKYQFINTAEVASITKILVERGKWGETYNIVGKGNITLAETAKIAGVTLKEIGKDVQVFDISTEKIEKEIENYPVTKDTFEKFSKEARV